MFASDNGILMTCGDGTLGCLGKELSINSVYCKLSIFRSGRSKLLEFEKKIVLVV